MKITIKRYDHIQKEAFVEEVFITGNPISIENIASDYSEKYPDSNINIQWNNKFTNELNSIHLQAINQKKDEEMLESGKMEWNDYAIKWYGSSFSTEFLKGLIIKKS
jgi:hypothetical protein